MTLRLWSVVPPEERMTEALVRHYYAQTHHGAIDEEWIAKWARDLSTPRMCPAAVPWFDLIEGRRYWRPCSHHH